jgi:hypothetical protein
MTRIVTAPKPRYQRRKKPANAVPVESRIVTATKPASVCDHLMTRIREVPESVKEFLRRMMQPPCRESARYAEPATVAASKQVHAEGSPQ